MRRVLMTAALTMAAMGASVPAYASATLNPINGFLPTKITADEGNGDTHDIVHGTDGVSPQDVIYDGNVDIAITGGGGYAEIDPGKGVTNFTTLIIDPLNDFVQYEFSLQTLADANISVYYMLAGDVTETWHLTDSGSVSDPFSQDANGNTNYVLSSDQVLTKLKITSDVGLKFVKQNSITLGSVQAPIPEPATWALMLLGFGGMGMALRRSRRRKTLMQIA
jgi:hypothetical protein